MTATLVQNRIIAPPSKFQRVSGQVLLTTGLDIDANVGASVVENDDGSLGDGATIATADVGIDVGARGYYCMINARNQNMRGNYTLTIENQAGADDSYIFFVSGAMFCYTKILVSDPRRNISVTSNLNIAVGIWIAFIASTLNPVQPPQLPY